MIKGRDINGRSRINIGTGRYEGQLGNSGFLEHSAIENRLQSFPLLFEYVTDFGDANLDIIRSPQLVHVVWVVGSFAYPFPDENWILESWIKRY